MKRERVIDAILIKEIKLLFDKGISMQETCMRHCRGKWQVGNKRFIVLFHRAEKEWEGERRIVELKTLEQVAGKNAEKGFLSKLEHRLECESEIKELKALLDRGHIVKKVSLPDGSSVVKKEVFGVAEIARLHYAVDQKRMELSKWEGWYAPTKMANTDVEGKAVEYAITLKL